MSMMAERIWAEFFSIYQTMSFNVSMTSKCSVTFRERNCYVKRLNNIWRNKIELKIPSPVRWVCGKTAKKTAWNINVSYARSGNDLRICAFDTNILIDLFSGRREAKQALEAATAECDQSDYRMEVMVGAKNITESSAREWR